MPAVIDHFPGSPSFREKLNGPVYSLTQIEVATFFGGPLAATYTIAENFKQFNRPEQARQTWIYGICITVVYQLVMLNLYSTSPWPVFLIVFATVIASRRIVKQTQTIDMAKHYSQNGKSRSGWYVFSVILTAYIFIAILAQSYLFYAAYAHVHQIATANQPSDSSPDWLTRRSPIT